MDFFARSSGQGTGPRKSMGTCTAGKMQRILAREQISQHAKLNMAGFVLYLLVRFGLRCRMVELCPKTKN